MKLISASILVIAALIAIAHAADSRLLSDAALESIIGGASCNYPYTVPNTGCAECESTGNGLEWKKCGSQGDMYCQYFPCGHCYQPDCLGGIAPCNGGASLYSNPTCTAYPGSGGFCTRSFWYAYQGGDAGYVYCPGS